MFKNKKALSAIITLMILILIVVAVTAIIWAGINKTIQNNLGSAKSCYNVFEKIEINSEYTCYNRLEEEMHFSIDIKDIEIQEILILIEGDADSKSFRITNETQEILGLKNYDKTSNIIIPKRNSGKTYIAESVLEKPISVEIAPIINGNFCDVADSLSNIYIC